MEFTNNIQLTGIHQREEKKIEIGQQAYLVSKHGISIRKEIILEKTFEKVPMDKGVAQHLYYSGSFNIDGKLLEVSAENKTTYGPLGERLLFHASYDGDVIGNYRALRSYMGGGSNGKWPFLKTNNCCVAFTLRSTGFGSASNQFMIEYFDTIIHDSNDINEDEKRKIISGETLSDEFLDDRYEIEDLKQHKVIEWLIPITKETSGKQIGKIACCLYPDFEMYRRTYSFNYSKKSEPKDEKIFIGKAIDENSLYTIEIELNDKTEIFYPWDYTEIYYSN